MFCAPFLLIAGQALAAPIEDRAPNDAAWVVSSGSSVRASAFESFLASTLGLPQSRIYAGAPPASADAALAGRESAYATLGTGGTLWVFYDGSPKEDAARGALLPVGKSASLPLDQLVAGDPSAGRAVFFVSALALPVSDQWRAPRGATLWSPAAGKEAAFCEAVLLALGGAADAWQGGIQDGTVTLQEARSFVDARLGGAGSTVLRGDSSERPLVRSRGSVVAASQASTPAPTSAPAPTGAPAPIGVGASSAEVMPRSITGAAGTTLGENVDTSLARRAEMAPALMSSTPDLEADLAKPERSVKVGGDIGGMSGFRLDWHPIKKSAWSVGFRAGAGLALVLPGTDGTPLRIREAHGVHVSTAIPLWKAGSIEATVGTTALESLDFRPSGGLSLQLNDGNVPEYKIGVMAGFSPDWTPYLTPDVGVNLLF